MPFDMANKYSFYMKLVKKGKITGGEKGKDWWGISPPVNMLKNALVETEIELGVLSEDREVIYC